MNEQRPTPGWAAICGGGLLALGSAMVMLRGVYIRHVVDGVLWSDPGGLMAVDWCVIKHWRPGWWQGWLFFGAFMLIGLRTLQIGIRIRRAELARGD